MRKFIRHPSDFPIFVSSVGEPGDASAQLCDISQGGFACQLGSALPPGNKVTLRIPCLDQDQRVSGKVVYCNSDVNGYRIGIQFDDETEAFKVKMVEQVCQIEHYRRELRGTGRELDAESAAYEWINRYGREFSDIFSGLDAN